MIYICKSELQAMSDQLFFSNLKAYYQFRNDKLNYYKFGLGLGMATEAPTIGADKQLKGGAAEAAAGGADQWVLVV